MKLAYFSPLNPQPSGISDYSEELLPQLAHRADITLFVDGFRPANKALLAQFKCVDYAAQSIDKQLSEFDAIIYHVGNDHRYHARIVETMRAIPGIAVFHDLALQDFFLGLARERKDLRVYLDEMLACHGEKERLLAEGHLRRGSVPPQVAAPLSYPLICRLARDSEGIITHSEWGRARLQSATAVPVRRINMPVSTGPLANTNGKSHQAKVSLASFGLITPGKGIEQVLRVLATLRDEFDFHYTLVGADNSYFNVRALIDEFGFGDRVTITGHVSLAEFQQRIAETDIALNIRERTVGETSASLCRIMAAGVPAIVADMGWYSEIPDDAVIKIPLDAHADALLRAYLRRLLADKAFRRRVGENARRYMLAEHSLEQAATGYLEFIDEVIARRPRRRLVAGVSKEMAALGASVEHFLQTVAVEVDLLAPALKSNASENGHHKPARAPAGRSEALAVGSNQSSGRLPKIENIDYKRAAIEYLGRLDEERHHHLRTKPFYNLANKPAKYKGEGMDEDMQRHFCDFANMAVTLALPPGSRVLDVGCGSGWLSEYFARLGYEVKGIDISPSLIEMSRERVTRVPYGVDHKTPLRCTFAVHDIELEPLDEKFAAIVCYDSLHHFADERSVMRNLAAMLPIGGQLFVLEGKRPPTGSPSENELRDVMREFQTLESPFDDDYLRALLDENGFAIVGNYLSINGLFERELLEGDRLAIGTSALNYHYLVCKKVCQGASAATVPDSRSPHILRADFRLLTPLSQSIAPGESFTIPLSITNSGDTLWLAGKSARTGVVMPGVRVTDDTNTLVNEFHGDPPLPQAIAPGETFNLTIAYTAPHRPGTYTLTIDLVDQHICWFEQRGSKPLSIEFVVE